MFYPIWGRRSRGDGCKALAMLADLRPTSDDHSKTFTNRIRALRTVTFDGAGPGVRRARGAGASDAPLRSCATHRALRFRSAVARQLGVLAGGVLQEWLADHRRRAAAQSLRLGEHRGDRRAADAQPARL